MPILPKIQFKFTFRPNRQLFEGNPADTISVQMPSPEKKSLSPEITPAAELIDQRQESLQNSIEVAKNSIQTANRDFLKSSGVQISPQAIIYLEDYFKSTIERFDQDKDGKISNKEAQAYQQGMLAKITDLIDKAKPDETTKSAKAEMDKAAAETQKSLENTQPLGEIKELSNQLEFAQSIEEFNGLQAQNAAFQTSVNQSIQKVQTFLQSLASYESSKQGFLNGLSNFKNQLLSPSADSLQVDQLQAGLNAAKAQSTIAINSLKAKQTILDKNGEKIKASLAGERQRLMALRDEQAKAIVDNNKNQADQIAAKKTEYQKIDHQQKSLEERQKGLLAKVENNADFRKQWASMQIAESLETKKQAFEQSTQADTAELAALKLVLEDPRLPPEAKTALQAEYQNLQNRQTKNAGNLKIVTERITKGQIVTRQLTAEEQAGKAELENVDNYLNQTVKPSLDSVNSNISRLEELKFQYATEAGQINQYYNKKVDQINLLDQSVSENVFSSAMGRSRSLESLHQAADSLNAISLNKDGYLMGLLKATAGVPQGLLHSIGEKFSGAAKLIDQNTAATLDMSKEGTFFTRNILHNFVQVAAIPAGFLSGGLELVGGFSTMFAHPLNTAEGMGSLIGRNPSSGEFTWNTFKSSWGHLGSALIGGKDWQEGHYGTSIGKTAFNILSMFIGSGAAAKAGTFSKAARMGAIDAAKLAGVKAGFWTGRLAETSAFFGTLARESIPAFAKNAYKAGAEVTAGQSLAKAVGSSLKTSAVDGAGMALKSLKNVAEVISYPLRSPLKTIKGALALSGKVLMAPVDLVKGVARVIKEVPSLARRLKSEGLINVFRSAKVADACALIAEKGAQYVQIQDQIAEIISKDSELSKLAKTGAEALQAQQIALHRLALADHLAVDAYLAVREAAETLQSTGQAFANDALKAVKKTKATPAISEAAAEYKKLKKTAEAATDPQSLQTAQTNFQNFQKDLVKMDHYHQFEAAEKTEQAITALLDQQKQIFNDYALSSSDSLNQAGPYRDPSIQAVDHNQNFLDHNQQITHDLGVLRIQSELPNLLKAEMTPEQALQVLQKRYPKKALGLSAKPEGAIAGEIKLQDSQTYQIKVEQDGAIKLVNKDPVPIAPATPLDSSLAVNTPASNPLVVDSLKIKHADQINKFTAKYEKAGLEPSILKEMKERIDKELNEMDIAASETEISQIINKTSEVVLDQHLSPAQITDLKNTIATYDQALSLKASLPADLEAAKKLIADKQSLLDYEKINLKKLQEKAQRLETQIKNAKKLPKSAALNIEQDLNTAKTAVTNQEALVTNLTTELGEAKMNIAQIKEAPGKQLEAYDEAVAKRFKENDQAIAKRLSEHQDTIQLEEFKLKIAKDNLQAETSHLKTAEKELAKPNLNPDVKTRLEVDFKNHQDQIAKLKLEIPEIEKNLQTARTGQKALEKSWLDNLSTTVGDFFHNPARREILDNIVKKLGDVTGDLADSSKKLAADLLQQAANGKAINKKVAIEKGFNVARSLHNIWKKISDPNQPFPGIYQDVLNQQLILISQLTKAINFNPPTLAGSSTEDQLKFLQAGWDQLAKASPVNSTHPEKLFYTAENLAYLAEQKLNFRKALEKNIELVSPTIADLTNQIDANLGALSATKGQSYAFSVDGITVNIAKDGQRTYQGMDQWIANQPKKHQIGEAFRETIEKYQNMTSLQLKQASGGKSINTAEDFQKLVEADLQKASLEKLATQEAKDFKVFSKSRTPAGQPNFIVDTTTGPLTASVNLDWAKSTFAAIKTKTN